MRVGTLHFGFSTIAPLSRKVPCNSSIESESRFCRQRGLFCNLESTFALLLSIYVCIDYGYASGIAFLWSTPYLSNNLRLSAALIGVGGHLDSGFP